MVHFAAGARAVPPKKRNEVRFSVSVTAEQKTALDEMAERERVSLAHLGGRAVAEFLERRYGGQLHLFDTIAPSSEEQQDK
jgi:hypothetical protein